MLYKLYIVRIDQNLIAFVLLDGAINAKYN